MAIDLQEIRDAMKSPKWCELSATERAGKLQSAIGRTYNLKGQSCNYAGEVYSYMVDELTRCITRRFSGIHVNEIELAWHYAVCGEFPNCKSDFIHAANLENWLSAYYVTAERTKINEESHIVRPSTIDTDALNAQAFDEAIHRGYEYYKASGGSVLSNGNDCGLHLPQWASLIYEHYRYNDSKIGEPTEQEKDIAMRYADTMSALHPTMQIGNEAHKIAYEDWYMTGLLGCYYASISGIPFMWN